MPSSISKQFAYPEGTEAVLVEPSAAAAAAAAAGGVLSSSASVGSPPRRSHSSRGFTPYSSSRSVGRSSSSSVSGPPPSRPKLGNFLSFRRRKQTPAAATPTAETVFGGRDFDMMSVHSMPSPQRAALPRSSSLRGGFVPPQPLLRKSEQSPVTRRRPWRKKKNDQLVADFFDGKGKASDDHDDDDNASQSSRSVWSAWSTPTRVGRRRPKNDPPAQTSWSGAPSAWPQDVQDSRSLPAAGHYEDDFDDELTLSSGLYAGSVYSAGSFSSMPSIRSAPSMWNRRTAEDVVFNAAAAATATPPVASAASTPLQLKKKKKKRGQWMRRLVWRRRRKRKSSKTPVAPVEPVIRPTATTTSLANNNELQAELNAMSARYYQEYVQRNLAASSDTRSLGSHRSAPVLLRPQQQRQHQPQELAIPSIIATPDKKNVKNKKTRNNTGSNRTQHQQTNQVYSDAINNNDDDASDVGSVMSILSGVLQAWSSERQAILNGGSKSGGQDPIEESKEEDIYNNNSSKSMVRKGCIKLAGAPSLPTPTSRYTVAFSVVQIREYERTVGDNPSCTAGPPISLGWSFQQVPDEPIAVHANRSSKRTKREFHLAAAVRTHLLQNEWSISEQDLRKARREATYIQYCREKSAFCGETSTKPEATFLRKTYQPPPVASLVAGSSSSTSTTEPEAAAFSPTALSTSSNDAPTMVSETRVDC